MNHQVKSCGLDFPKENIENHVLENGKVQAKLPMHMFAPPNLKGSVETEKSWGGEGLPTGRDSGGAAL